jgi:hypothetical protein
VLGVLGGGEQLLGGLLRGLDDGRLGGGGGLEHAWAASAPMSSWRGKRPVSRVTRLSRAGKKWTIISGLFIHPTVMQ